MQNTQMLEGLVDGLKWATEGDPRSHGLASERIISPEKVAKDGWPFTPEWRETVRVSEIPANFPIQKQLFSTGLVALHPEWSTKGEKVPMETVASFARMLGIDENLDRETVAYAFSLAGAISKTKLALEADDPRTWIRVETSYKNKSHVAISYNSSTVEAIRGIETLDDAEAQTNKNRLTHALPLRLGNFARQSIEENFGGNPVGLTVNERREVAEQLQTTAASRSVSRSADFYKERLSNVQTAVNSGGEQLGARLEEWLPMARTLEELATFYTFCAENLTGEESFVPVLTEKFNSHLVELVKPFTEKSVSPGYYHAKDVA